MTRVIDSPSTVAITPHQNGCIILSNHILYSIFEPVCVDQIAVRLRNILGGTVRKTLIEILNVAWLSVLDSSAETRSVSFFITARTTTAALRHINASEKYAHYTLLFHAFLA